MNSKDNKSIERQDEKEKWINLVIKDIQGEEHYLGKVYLSESIDSIKQKYREIKYLCGDCKIVLSYGGRCIDNKETLADIGLDPNDICEEVIFHAVIRLTGGGRRIGGGYSVAFIDVEKANITKLSFGKAPKYREVTKGLNFSGICKCRLCEAKDKTVYMKFGMGTFNYFKLISEYKFVCPICESSVFPESFGFWCCKYDIKGKGITEGETELRTFSRSGFADTDYFERFDPATDLEDKVNYIELIFTVSYFCEFE